MLCRRAEDYFRVADCSETTSQPNPWYRYLLHGMGSTEIRDMSYGSPIWLRLLPNGSE